MKVVVVMTYFERPFQLAKTLASIASTKYQNFEVVIVDDGSQNKITSPYLEYPITVIRTSKKRWSNPEPAYNIGIAKALAYGADVIILQNAECYHVGDVISYAATVNDQSYFSFGCFSINEKQTFIRHDIRELIRCNNFGASFDGQNAWYNHSTHRPCAYDFCSAITKSNILKLNGYDERLSEGMAFGDNYLLHRIALMGLEISIVDDPFVVHQWHYNGKGVPENKAELVQRNRLLYSQLVDTREVRAKHIFTDDLQDTFN